MKVLEINTVTNGCTGRIAESIRGVLEEKGHRCIIAYGRGKGQRSDDYKISSFLDSNIHGGLTRIFDTSGLHSKRKTKKLISFIDSYKPDVIHIHNLHGYFINYPMLFEYIKKKNVKVFWTLHDCWAFTGHCPYFTYVACKKWMTGCHHCQQKLHHPTSYIMDRSAKNYRDKKKAFCGVNKMILITPSSWLKSEVEHSFLQEYEVINIPNGISMESFHPTTNEFRRKNQLEDKIIILGVSNLWAKTKGMEYFIQLSEELDNKYQVVLVGLSDRQKHQLPKKIIGINKTESISELADIYSSADIFINPTSEDNFPTTNIEALACGTPVITFKTGGSPEAINESCGMVVSRNIMALREACISMGRKNKKIIKNCLERSKLFDEKLCYRKYVELYEK